jgi:hypothetical protein
MLAHVLVLALTLPAPRPTPRPAHSAAPNRQRARGLPPVAAGDLYSARVRRRLASYMRLRLLELRKAGLERAAGVIERRLPIETLFERR